jgi:phage tail-like protein
MATFRETPYGAFNYRVSFGPADDTIVAGFSDVSGLGTEVSYSEYRNGNDVLNTARKVPNTYKQEDVVLKRGLVGDVDTVWAWLKATREGKIDRRQVVITLLDESRNPVLYFRLLNAQPKKWVGPTLAAKGGGEVAMEELHLVHEGVTVE